jgi:endonuclease/exonuclease/phosphatase family metal-dependent hydrolase
MGERLEDLVTQKSGRTWYRQNVNGMGDGRGVGNVLLSRYPLASASSTLLSYNRGVAQIGIVVNGRNVNLFSTHVEYDNASWRPIQIAEAARWMSSFSEPRITMGDFNTSPDTIEYRALSSWMRDAWTTAVGSGTATAYNGTGATHGSSRFDYVFSSANGVLSTESADVPDTRVNGVFASDHDPVIVVFGVD